MKDRKKKKKKNRNGAVSVSQRQPSPRHHLLPFADVKARAEAKGGGGWKRGYSADEVVIIVNIHTDQRKKMFFWGVGGVI